MRKLNRVIGLLLLLMLLQLTFAGVLAVPAELTVEEIHNHAFVVDTHNDTMMKVIHENNWRPVIDIGGPTPDDFQLDLKKAREGGLDVAFYAAYTDYRVDHVNMIERTNSRSLALINALYWTADQNRENMVLASSLREIEQGVEAGQHVAVASLEGMYQFTSGNAIELLHQYVDLGVRAAGIVWNSGNSLGAGTYVHNDAPDAGLTETGRDVIREMNRLGVLVDVSHMNETTFFDTMDVVRAPVIASHSGVDGVRPHDRNLSDEQLLLIKESGGVVQINFWATTVADIGEYATISKLVDHIDYVVDFIGIDHVGLGSDFDGAPMPVDLPDASHLPGITQELVARGYNREEIEKVLGKNTLRVLKEVEGFAEKAPAVERGLGFTIIPNLAMGEMVHDDQPLLSAKVISHGRSFVDLADYRIIVNGVAHEAVFHPATGEITLQMPNRLLGKGRTEDNGNYHVVTFEGRSRYGFTARETVIIYVL